jgi:hypothetical protein
MTLTEARRILERYVDGAQDGPVVATDDDMEAASVVFDHVWKARHDDR